MSDVMSSSILQSSSSCINCSILHLASFAACLLLFRCPISSVSFGFVSFSFGSSTSVSLSSREQTRVSGLSIVCPFVKIFTPRTTLSFPLISSTTFPRFHSARFFSSPTTNIISPTSGHAFSPLITR